MPPACLLSFVSDRHLVLDPRPAPNPFSFTTACARTSELDESSNSAGIVVMRKVRQLNRKFSEKHHHAPLGFAAPRVLASWWIELRIGNNAVGRARWLPFDWLGVLLVVNFHARLVFNTFERVAHDQFRLIFGVKLNEL